MNEHFEGGVRILRQVVKAAMDDRVTFIAASIAFYAVLSIFPLLLLLLAVGSWLVGEAFAAAVLDMTSGLLTPEALALIEEGLVTAPGRGGASLLGIVFLTWTAIKVFRGLDIAFSTVYGAADDPSFLSTTFHALVVLLALGAGITAVGAIQLAVATIPDAQTSMLVSPFASFLSLTILFFPMYYVFSAGQHSAISVLPGTAVAAAGWTLLGELFGIYAANAATYALFGLIGGFMLLLMWFYFGAIVLLIGAILNAVLAGRFDDATDHGSGLVERPIGPGVDDSNTGDE